MNKIRVISAALLAALAGLITYSNVTVEPPRETTEQPVSILGKPGKTMRPFRSADELRGFFKELAERQRRDSQKQRGGSSVANMSKAESSPTGVALDGVTADDAKDAESVTNTQHAGVDEGGIVKVHGDHLVILRRGRLFTVRIGDGSLSPVASLDAYAPDVNPSND